jgi:undecaprenyl-diphosphatase
MIAPATPRARVQRLFRFLRGELAAVLALFVITVGVMTFVEVADDMTEADGRAFDQAVLEAVRPYADPGQPWGPWWLKEMASDITALGSLAVLSLFALIIVGFLLFQRKWLSATLLAVGLGGGVMLSEGLKGLFERERPPVDYQVVETINASFPSGHALMSTVFYLSIGVMLTRAFPRRRFKSYVMGVAITVALLVGLTRIYLGAHWASDVFAGWSLGAAWAMALWLMAYAVERIQARRGGALHDECGAVSQTVQTSNTR